MSDSTNAAPPVAITLLQQRTIEAKIVGPLIQGFAQAFGTEQTLRVVSEVIKELARTAGAEFARQLGEASLTGFAACLDTWRAGDAIELDILRSDNERLEFNVTRCRFAEMYRALGLEDLGAALSCTRDFALVEGFNPAIRLERTQTIMEGATHCDFRFQSQNPNDGEAGCDASAPRAVKSDAQPADLSDIAG